ncbi:MAG: gamma-glutamylcyclotransferase [Proteobacteria bacterium]|nr:gamma-glutamylcyclotransferase [Pseudomonadota bacterium]
MRFFFYGTLLDRDVTALVLGRRLPAQAFVPAELPGWSRWRVEGGSYPVSLPDRKGCVSGAVVSGLSARDVAHLAAYEGAGYRISSLRVRIAGKLTTVSVFEPIVSRLKPTNRPWDLTLWQRQDKKSFVGRLVKALSGRRGYSRP